MASLEVETIFADIVERAKALDPVNTRKWFEKLKVLYLEGFPPRRETPFLRRGLDASADIHVDFVTLDARRPRSHPPNLIERLKPGRYDAYIIGASGSDPHDLARSARVRASSETPGSAAGNVINGIHRGVYADTNRWMSDPKQSLPQWIELRFPEPKRSDGNRYEGRVRN